MYRFRTLAVAVALLVIVSLGCGDSSNTTGSGSGSSGSAFTVTVGSGTTPTYTWSAGDGFSVTVVRTSAATAPVWGIASPGSELISSAVTHSTVPTVNGGLITVTAVTETPLTAGTQYRVTISRLNGDTGFIEFTP